MGRSRGWPATLIEPDLLDAPVVLRPIRAADVKTRHALHAANDSWLQPWNPAGPDAAPYVTLARRSPLWPYLSAARRRWESSRGIAYAWVIHYGGQFAGELTVWHILWGPTRSAEVSYWVDERLAGRGIAPTALAMGADHCFMKLGLHRLEAGIQPENTASRRVVEKLGFRDEGTRIGLVHINGAWRDHVCYAITADQAPGGLLLLWRNSLAASRAGRAKTLP